MSINERVRQAEFTPIEHRIGEVKFMGGIFKKLVIK